MKINQKIRKLREMHELTQEDMAEKLQMSTNGYANIERGASKVNLDKLEQIAQIFELDLSELVSFGERNTVYCSGGANNVNSGLNIIGHVDDALSHEVSNLRSQLKHYQELTAFQKQELKSLQEIITLLKKQIP